MPTFTAVTAKISYLFASDVDNYHIHYDLVQEPINGHRKKSPISIGFCRFVSPNQLQSDINHH